MKNNYYKKRINAGFTLVELSIVFVIIGLLVGGIMAAQSMIQTAKVNKQIKQIEQIKIAVTNFQTTYNSLPGDTNKLGAGGSQPDATTAGDGDGYIVGYKYTVTPGNVLIEPNSLGYFYVSAESMKVFEHLALAKMYPFNTYDETNVSVTNLYPGIMYPKMVVESNPTARDIVQQGGVVVGFEPGPLAHINQGHKIKLGFCPSSIVWPDQPSFWCGPLPKDAAAIDGKIDDGRPYSGSVYVTAKHYIYRVPNGFVIDQTNDCGDSTTNTYLISSATGNCVVTVDMGF